MSWTVPEAARRMFQEYRGRNYPIITERGLEQLYVSAVIRVGVVSGWPCAVIVLIITAQPLSSPLPHTPCRFPSPDRPITPLVARARERESPGLAGISERRFSEKNLS